MIPYGGLPMLRQDRFAKTGVNRRNDTDKNCQTCHGSVRCKRLWTTEFWFISPVAAVRPGVTDRGILHTYLCALRKL